MTIDKAKIEEAQRELIAALGLSDLGHTGAEHDGVDGDWGRISKKAAVLFQKEHDLPQTGRLDKATLAALQETDTGAQITAQTASNHWECFLEPDGQQHPDGRVTGHIVLHDPTNSANELKVDFISGPFGKGAAPGLRGEKDLKKGSLGGLDEPATVYHLGKLVEATDDPRFTSHDGKSNFIIPLQNSAIVKRDKFLIHPNASGKGTEGCIGIPLDNQVHAFEKKWRELEREGKAPTEMAVAHPPQYAQTLELAKSGKVIKEHSSLNQQEMAENMPSPIITPHVLPPLKGPSVTP